MSSLKRVSVFLKEETQSEILPAGTEEVNRRFMRRPVSRESGGIIGAGSDLVDSKKSGPSVLQLKGPRSCQQAHELGKVC